MVLCHSDMHAGNLLIPPGTAGGDPSLFIVDWDNPTFAPKERDLAMIGGSSVWQTAQEEALFYQGYQSDGSQVEIDGPALSYYRYERIIQDIAAFCQALLLTSAGGEDREQSYTYFTGAFLPGHEIDLALQNDAGLSEPPPIQSSR
jgi:spectinomycin phosphotransferase